MGHQELIDSLRSEGEKKAQAIKQEAAAEAEQIKAEMVKRLERFREDYRKNHLMMVEEQSRKIVSEASERANRIKLQSERVLLDRLYTMSLALLRDLRTHNYSSVFERLVRELPPLPWKILRVNPDDREIAKEHFPDADIIADRTISGGLEVTSEDGKVHIINTFEKRLERAWSELLPEFMHEQVF